MRKNGFCPFFGGENVINLFALIVESVRVRGDKHVNETLLLLLVEMKPHMDTSKKTV